MTVTERWLLAAVAVLAFVSAGLGVAVWTLATRPAVVTVQPPCYIKAPGFHLPPGGRWC